MFVLLHRRGTADVTRAQVSSASPSEFCPRKSAPREAIRREERKIELGPAAGHRIGYNDRRSAGQAPTLRAGSGLGRAIRGAWMRRSCRSKASAFGGGRSTTGARFRICCSVPAQAGRSRRPEARMLAAEDAGPCSARACDGPVAERRRRNAATGSFCAARAGAAYEHPGRRLRIRWCGDTSERHWASSHLVPPNALSRCTLP